MIQHYAKVDKGQEDDDNPDEDAAGREGLERERHRPGCHEPVGENDREPNPMDHCFLKIERIKVRRCLVAWESNLVRTLVCSFLRKTEILRQCTSITGTLDTHQASTSSKQ